jgi:hypothetical protein
LHKHRIISFSCHTGVSTHQACSYHIVCQIAATPTSFSANSWNLLTVPSDHSLDHAEGLNNFMSSLSLVCK